MTVRQAKARPRALGMLHTVGRWPGGCQAASTAPGELHALGDALRTEGRSAHLAVIGPQRPGHELVGARPLVLRQPRTEELVELACCERLVGLDDGVDRVAVLLVGQPDHAR